MPLLALVIIVLLASLSGSASSPRHCLPREVKSTDIVSTQEVRSGPHRGEVTTVTVAQVLKKIRARCRKGKLFDPRGKEIRFYRLVNCWGNPPENYQEIIDRQTKELEALRKRYHVIEMTCNPSGERIS